MKTINLAGLLKRSRDLSNGTVPMIIKGKKKKDIVMRSNQEPTKKSNKPKSGKKELLFITNTNLYKNMKNQTINN